MAGGLLPPGIAQVVQGHHVGYRPHQGVDAVILDGHVRIDFRAACTMVCIRA